MFLRPVGDFLVLASRGRVALACRSSSDLGSKRHVDGSSLCIILELLGRLPFRRYEQ